MTASVDTSTFRRVLGHYPSGVTVVTSVHGGRPAGFTCQSFHSLSLDPPLVLLLPSRTSTTWPKIRDSASFCVNVLSDAQADLCRRFAVSGGDKFAGLEWSPGPTGAPRLPGCTAWIDCELEAEVDGGDHYIATARVVHLSAARENEPLVFHRGTYRTLSPQARNPHADELPTRPIPRRPTAEPIPA